VDYGELWSDSQGPNGISFTLRAIPKSPFRWQKW
jgi:hypothetical protein